MNSTVLQYQGTRTNHRLIGNFTHTFCFHRQNNTTNTVWPATDCLVQNHSSVSVSLLFSERNEITFLDATTRGRTTTTTTKVHHGGEFKAQEVP